MKKNLHYYRSELKSKDIKSYKLIGITSEMILSTELFPRNEELIDFLKTIFNLSYKEYVFKSKTLVIARTSRDIFNMDKSDFESSRKKLYKFVTYLLDDEIDQTPAGKSTKLNRWIEGISNDNY